jgi:hypothetical protein
MIYGDELILTKQGFHISNSILETVGIYPGTNVNILLQ